MASPDRPTELSSHSFQLPAVGRRGLDYGGFFIVQAGHESNRIIGGFLILFVVGSKRNYERPI